MPIFVAITFSLLFAAFAALLAALIVKSRLPFVIAGWLHTLVITTLPANVRNITCDKAPYPYKGNTYTILMGAYTITLTVDKWELKAFITYDYGSNANPNYVSPVDELAAVGVARKIMAHTRANRVANLLLMWTVTLAVSGCVVFIAGGATFLIMHTVHK